MLEKPAFNQDVVFDYEEIGPDKDKQNRKLIISSAEIADKSNLSAEEFIEGFLTNKDFKLTANDKRNLQMQIIWHREVGDLESLYEGVQMWLLAMQGCRFTQIMEVLKPKANYNVDKVFEEIRDII